MTMLLDLILVKEYTKSVAEITVSLIRLKKVHVPSKE